MRGLELIIWPQGQWKASERTAPDGTDKHTHTVGHGNSMTNKSNTSPLKQDNTNIKLDFKTYMNDIFYLKKINTTKLGFILCTCDISFTSNTNAYFGHYESRTWL